MTRLLVKIPKGRLWEVWIQLSKIMNTEKKTPEMMKQYEELLKEEKEILSHPEKIEYRMGTDSEIEEMMDGEY